MYLKAILKSKINGFSYYIPDGFEIGYEYYLIAPIMAVALHPDSKKYYGKVSGFRNQFNEEASFGKSYERIILKPMQKCVLKKPRLFCTMPDGEKQHLEHDSLVVIRSKKIHIL